MLLYLHGTLQEGSLNFSLEYIAQSCYLPQGIVVDHIDGLNPSELELEHSNLKRTSA